MVTQLIQENEDVLKRFVGFIRHQRLAHAYLFIGPQGIGKGQTALAVAKLINCEDQDARQAGRYCGRCSTCLRVDSGNHPDVSVISSGEENTIKISVIRDVISRLQLRPYEARVKVFIIEKIEELTLEGSNALLKTLEEPAPNSLLLLTTDILEKNLGTIRSRCHAVYFFAKHHRRLAQDMEPSSGLDPAACRFLAAYAQGYPGRAQYFLKTGLVDRKNDWVNRLVLKKNDQAFLKKILADRQQTRAMLDILLTWFRDVLVLKSGAAQQDLIHGDRVQDLQRMAGRYTRAQIEEIIREIVQNARLLGENLNIKIAMQILMEKIWLR